LQDSGFTSAAFMNGSEADAVKAVQAHGEKMKANSPAFRQSILQDADRNRRLEVHETLDYTLKLARNSGSRHRRWICAAESCEWCHDTPVRRGSLKLY